jgi:hypothetical protein
VYPDDRRRAARTRHRRPGIDFVVGVRGFDRTQLSEIVQRVRDGRLRTNIVTEAPKQQHDAEHDHAQHDQREASQDPTLGWPGSIVGWARPSIG